MNEVDEWLALARAGNYCAAWEVSDRLVRERGGQPCWHLPRHQQPVWNGEPVDGRRVLVRCYHGLGDTIQFARFAPMLAARAAAVTWWAQPALIPLLSTVAGIEHLEPLTDGSPSVPYDVDLESMELGHLFRVNPEFGPSAVPYLHVAPAALGSNGRFRVGLAWQGGDWDARRAVPFADLSALLELSTIDWYSLQQTPSTAQAAAGVRWLALNNTVDGTARLVRALDLVITVDTMTAHLAGALGVPVWTLLTRDADWRWMESRDDSPWYPTMRLFRQERAGEWAPVIERVRMTLNRLLDGGP